jgi:hypothetical protein
VSGKTQGIASAQVIGTITRADGTVEHLGVISYWHKNPLRRLWWRITSFWRRPV